MQSDYEHEFKFTDLFGLSFVRISLDVSSNQVTFRIQEQWNEKYSDPTTKEYVNLKQQMAEEVNEIKQCCFFSNFSSPKWSMLVKTAAGNRNLSFVYFR